PGARGAPRYARRRATRVRRCRSGPRRRLRPFPTRRSSDLGATFHPVADGKGTLAVTFGGRSLTLPVKVERAKEQPPILTGRVRRSEEHTSELQSPCNLVCRLLLEKTKESTVARRAPPPART